MVTSSSSISPPLLGLAGDFEGKIQSLLLIFELFDLGVDPFKMGQYPLFSIRNQHGSLVTSGIQACQINRRFAFRFNSGAILFLEAGASFMKGSILGCCHEHPPIFNDSRLCLRMPRNGILIIDGIGCLKRIEPQSEI